MKEPINETNVRSISERIAYLIVLFINDQLNSAEQAELAEWVAESDQNVTIFNDTVDIGKPTYFPYGYRVKRKIL